MYFLVFVTGPWRAAGAKILSFLVYTKGVLLIFARRRRENFELSWGTLRGFCSFWRAAGANILSFLVYTKGVLLNLARRGAKIWSFLGVY